MEEREGKKESECVYGRERRGRERERERERERGEREREREIASYPRLRVVLVV